MTPTIPKNLSDWLSKIRLPKVHFNQTLFLRRKEEVCAKLQTKEKWHVEVIIMFSNAVSNILFQVIVSQTVAKLFRAILSHMQIRGDYIFVQVPSFLTVENFCASWFHQIRNSVGESIELMASLLKEYIKYLSRNWTPTLAKVGSGDSGFLERKLIQA